MKQCYLVLKEYKKLVDFFSESSIIMIVSIEYSLVMMAERSHPFPYRTRKLSSLAPMVVGTLSL